MRPTPPTGFLSALRRNKCGNTAIMTAFAIIPIFLMLGSGVDASRTYLVKARLQSACDAGVLATRKTMDGSGTINDDAKASGKTFFDNNFPNDTYGATNKTFTPSLDATQQVIGTATVRLPMRMMPIFGKSYTDLTAMCGARLDIKNADVMFVLDTTGSMGGARIAGLRTAVVNFTKTLSDAKQGDARIRYGFVPYSSTVNVGALLQAQSSSWVSSAWQYRSRVANFNTGVITAFKNRNNPATPVYEKVQGTFTLAQCRQWGGDYASGITVLSTSGNQAKGRSYSNADSDYGAGPDASNPNSCTRNYVDQTYIDPTIRYRFTNWTYGLFPYNAATYKGATVNVADDDPLPSFTVGTALSANLVDLAALPGYTAAGNTVLATKWDGCIEERDTVPNATFDYANLPSQAYDLNVDMVPTSAATSWRPAWPQLVWDPTTYGGPVRLWDYRDPQGYYVCPAPARKLGVMTQAEVQTYVNSLVALGGTYHDTGMIWGARLISPTGIFGAENKTAPNKDEISRNVVFMTDGDMKPHPDIVSMYGYEHFDKRVTGSGTPSESDLKSRHNQRFIAMCQYLQKTMKVNLYVVAFAEAVTAEERACAAPGPVYFASSPADLNKQFTDIATKIAKLRLQQ